MSRRHDAGPHSIEECLRYFIDEHQSRPSDNPQVSKYRRALDCVMMSNLRDCIREYFVRVVLDYVITIPGKSMGHYVDMLVKYDSALIEIYPGNTSDGRKQLEAYLTEKVEEWRKVRSESWRNRAYATGSSTDKGTNGSSSGGGDWGKRPRAPDVD